MGLRIYNYEHTKKIISLYYQGLSQCEIGKKLNLSRQYVSYFLIKNGIRASKPCEKRIKAVRNRKLERG